MPFRRPNGRSWKPGYVTSCDDLKTLLFRDLSRQDKLLLILSSFGEPCQVRDVRARGEAVGFRAPKKWNVSQYLHRSKGLAINTRHGWELADAGKLHLRQLGVGSVSRAAAEVAVDLRRELPRLQHDDTRAYVEEAVACYEHQLYRAAIVMSWVGAVAILHAHVIATHLAAFNAEAQRVDRRWKSASTTDDLARMRESDFLDRVAAISVFGNDVKKELKNCLGLRNSCGHPNSLRISANTAARHLEVLLLNVFTKYQ